MTYLIILAAGALIAMCVRFFPLSDAAYIIGPWLYLPCFLYVCRNMTKPAHFVLWAVFWCVSFVVRYWGILSPFNLWVSIGLQFAAAAVYVLPFLLDRFVWIKNGGAVCLFVFPFAFAAVDFILELTRAGSLFSLAQTQFDNKPFLQLACVLGSKGIVFILALSASLLVYFCENPKGTALCLAGVLALHLCGAARISARAPIVQAADTLVLGWSAEPVKDDSFFAESSGDLELNTKCLKRAAAEAKEKNVALLCFPEETFFVNAEDHDEFIERAKAIAAGLKINLLLPVESDSFGEDDEGINHCLFIDQNGNIMEDYMKTMLIPVAEEPYYLDGSGNLPNIDLKIGERNIKISYAICFDGDFPSYIRKIPDDTDLFIDVSWDWDEVDELHYRIIGLRAVENGLTVLKPTVCGYSTVTDCLGHIRSITHSNDTGYTGVNTVDIPLAKCPAPYHRIGGFVDWSYFAGLALFALLSLLKK